MYDNPWHVENIAHAQRERLQEEMKQIRLEEAALKSRTHRPALLLQAWLLLRQWLQAGKKKPVPALGTKHGVGIDRSSVRGTGV